MRIVDRLRHFARVLLVRSRVDRDLRDELAHWTDELTERHLARGVPPDTAQRLARADVGAVDSLRQQVLDEHPATAFRGCLTDLRYAWRGLRRAPIFTAAVVVTLSLGIGASTAIFTIVHAMLLSPIPYRDSSRLVFIWEDLTSGGYPRAPLSAPELDDLRRRSTRFEGFGSIWATSGTLTEGEPEQIHIGLVTTNFFDLLGVDAALGRTFRPADDQATGSSGVVLSWSLFQRRFGGDRSVVGRRLLISGLPRTVLGVMPAGFVLLLPPDAAVPDDLQAFTALPTPTLLKQPRGQQYLRVVGRLKPSVSLADARADVNAVAAAISREFVEYGSAGRQFRTVGLQDDDVREVKPSLVILFGGVGLLALVACINVAGLLVARAADQTRDTALRAALGAGRARLIRLCLAEAFWVSTLGATAGIALAQIALSLILALRPVSLHRLGGSHMDAIAVLFACGVAVVCACVFSLGPVLHVIGTDLGATLGRGDHRTSTGVRHQRLRSALVFGQIATGIVLLVGAGLLVRTVLAMERADLGFHSDQMLTFRLSVPGQRYRSVSAINDVSRRLLTAVTAVPGVVGSGAISHVPFDDSPNWGGPYLSAPDQDASMAADADYRTVTPGFFEETGVRLLAGRFFTESDDPSTQPVVIVDDHLAERVWRGRSALGNTLWLDPGSSGRPTFAVSVIGVVHHLRLRSVVADLAEQVFFAQRQVPRNPIAYVVRTDRDMTSAVPALRRAIADVDPLIPIADVRPFDAYTHEASASGRFTATLAAVLALVTLALASVGLYGVVAYGVVQRTREFAVRLALGARPGQLIGMALTEGGRIAGYGTLVGLALAALAARALRTELYGVSPIDPITLGAATVALAVAALVACGLPARRAARATPADALKTN